MEKTVLYELLRMDTLETFMEFSKKMGTQGSQRNLLVACATVATSTLWTKKKNSTNIKKDQLIINI